jgi:hypothetical protein
MPPFLISPLAKMTVASVAAGALISWAVKEVLRMKQELESLRTAPDLDPSVRQTFPTLRRDPQTGDWRVS